MRCPGRAPRGAKQWSVFLILDTCHGDVFIKVGLELRNARRLMLLAALLVQAYPRAMPLAEVIAHIHLQNRADAGEGVNHDAAESTITQPGERADVDRRDERPCFVAVKHRRPAFL